MKPGSLNCLRVQQRGGVPHGELLACRAEDDRGFDEHGFHLVAVAFGLRHPDAAGSNQPSVYERAYRRLSTAP